MFSLLIFKCFILSGLLIGQFSVLFFIVANLSIQVLQLLLMCNDLAFLAAEIILCLLDIVVLDVF